MTPRWIALLALALALGACRHPAPGEAYPTFELMTSSRMFPVMVGDVEQLDLAAMAKDLAKVESVGRINEEARTLTAQLSQPDRSSGPSAALKPALPTPERMLYALAPVVMMKLEPLWHEERWTPEQVAQANHGAAVIGRIAGAPRVAFADGDDAGNRAGLVALVRWFRAAAAKPEQLAAMLFTLDDGPYVGLPYATDALLPATKVLRIGDRFELRLAQVERAPESWVMQGVRDGKLAWSRVVSGLPDGEVTRVVFFDVAPVALGAYGWHVPFGVEWDFGREQAHLYLDPEGELRFYFLSW